MIYSFDIARLPEIKQVYTVVRRTVWEIADSRNILFVVLGGCCNVELDNKVYLLCAGDILFIPRNQVYKRNPVGDEYCKILYVHFTTAEPLCELTETDAAAEIYNLYVSIENQLLNNTKRIVPYISKIYLSDYLQPGNYFSSDATERMEKLLSNHTVDNSLMMTLYLCELLTAISLENIKKIRQKISIENEEFDALLNVPSKLKKAIHFIRQNHTSKITLDDLCRHCSISKSQLTRYFKEIFGKTPVQYIIELKLNSAKELFLNSPQLSIKNVANELGFEDQHYFSRIFTKYMGETPSEYKYRVLNFKED